MWPPQPGQSCCAGYSTRSRSGRARANNLAISCLQKQSKHHSLNARASQLCRSSFFERRKREKEKQRKREIAEEKRRSKRWPVATPMTKDEIAAAADGAEKGARA